VEQLNLYFFEELVLVDHFQQNLQHRRHHEHQIHLLR
jgi:hypothetical protein